MIRRVPVPRLNGATRNSSSDTGQLTAFSPAAATSCEAITSTRTSSWSNTVNFKKRNRKYLSKSTPPKWPLLLITSSTHSHIQIQPRDQTYIRATTTTTTLCTPPNLRDQTCTLCIRTAIVTTVTSIICRPLSLQGRICTLCIRTAIATIVTTNICLLLALRGRTCTPPIRTATATIALLSILWVICTAAGLHSYQATAGMHDLHTQSTLPRNHSCTPLISQSHSHSRFRHPTAVFDSANTKR